MPRSIDRDLICRRKKYHENDQVPVEGEATILESIWYSTKRMIAKEEKQENKDMTRVQPSGILYGAIQVELGGN